MKTKTLLSIAMVMMMAGAFAQKPSMTLTFTADNNGQHVALNSILIENLTQGGDTTLFAPDTVLVLDYITGIGENETIWDNAFNVTQNYPNPMQGQTTISLNMPENGHIFITVSDIMGRELIRQELRLNQGNHSFTFCPGRESLYFLTARVNHQSQTIKMINNPSRTYGSRTCSLEYSGEAKGSGAYKSEMFLNNFAFSLGDQLKFTGLTDLGERVITSSPTGDQTYYFHYTGDPCSDAPTVTDMDGNVYNTVLIGNQCWMKENLKTTTYKNGTPIPNVTDGSAWSILTTGAYTWYDNNISWKDKYGALYNWYAVDDPDGLCPEGWHAPSDAEWTQLTDFIGGDAWLIGNKMKSCRQLNSPLGGGCNATEHPRWDQHNIWYGTDDFGFSGHPGSMRSLYGDFSGIGGYASWWSSTEYTPYVALSRVLMSINGLVYDYNFGKNSGISIRCLRDSAPSAAFTGEPTSGTAPLTVSFTDQSTNTPTSWQWDFGDSNTSTQQNPAHTYQIAGTYTVQLTVANSYGSDTEIKTNYITVTSGGGTGVPCPDMPTVTDIDGNVYNTDLIGDQCWMKENLKTTTYKNGTQIPNVTEVSAWTTLTTGAYVWYNNDISWKDKYGALYNWFTVSDPNGLCPEGWHVLSNSEWTQLTDFIGGTAFPNGNKLKSCLQVNSPLGDDCNTTVHPRWVQHSTHYGTDDYGFSGLPGGYRTSTGTFDKIGYVGFWWSSSEYSSDDAWGHALNYNYGDVHLYNGTKQGGFSVRCLRDSPPSAAFIAEPTIGTAPLTVNFTDQSTNSPSTWQWDFGDGGSSTQQNPEYTYQDTGTYTLQLTVTNSYGSDTSIKINYIIVTYGGGTGEPCPGVPTVSYEGQVYNTVFIGSQCWLKENLNVGTMINGSLNQTNNDTIEKYCQNNDTANCDIYGGLYQWNEMMGYSITPGVQGICPPGWHLPTDEEWKQLEGEVDSQYGYPDPEWNGIGYRGYDAGKNLKSTTGWNSGGTGTNLYDFDALPGGILGSYGTFSYLGSHGQWWSSSEISNTTAWYRSLYYYTDGSYRLNTYNYKSYGRSVRCLKN